MTLLETERLIRKMTELLQQGGNPDLALKPPAIIPPRATARISASSSVKR
jgi:hypothetical protein